MAGEKNGPLDQFTIKPLVSIDIGGADLSFTNSSLAMLITVLSISLFLVVGMSRAGGSRWRS